MNEAEEELVERHRRFVRLAMFVGILILIPCVLIGRVFYLTGNYLGLFIIIALSILTFVAWAYWSLKKLFSQYELEKRNGR